MSYHSFEDLRVWKKARRLAVDIYQTFKSCRDWGLKDQITRSAVSVASNIAEGAERGSDKDFSRFLKIAKGSAAELRTQIYIAAETGILADGQKQQLVAETKQVSSMLQSLITSLANADPRVNADR